MQTLAKGLAWTLLGTMAAWGAACSDDTGGEASTSSGGGGAGASGGSGGASDCEIAGDCQTGAVCDPATSTCQADLPCETHADCGNEGACVDGTCAQSTLGGECDDDDNCVGTEVCTGGKCGCGGELYGAENVPPNVLIVLDRSGSMNDNIGGGTKWSIAKQAIADMLATYGGGVRFGLMLYPGTNQSGSQGMDCGPGAVFVDPAPMTEGSINSFLQGANTTQFGTPTAEALRILPDYMGLEDPERGNYVVLITDGNSTCDDPVPEVTALRNESPEIKTFVIGFGQGVDPNELNDMAQAGGTAKPQQPFYYQADDAASLGAAFASIAGSVLSCNYTLSNVPSDLDLLFVYADGTEVDYDTTHANGWDYDVGTGQITFYGPICDALTAGTVGDLLISYGCPPPDIGEVK